MTRKWREATKLTIFDLDQASGRDTSPVQERTMLESTRLLDANIQPKRRIGDLYRRQLHT